MTEREQEAFLEAKAQGCTCCPKMEIMPVRMEWEWQGSVVEGDGDAVGVRHTTRCRLSRVAAAHRN